MRVGCHSPTPNISLTSGRVMGMSENHPENADSGEVELVIVTMSFDAADMGSLVAVLSKYIVLTRMEQGCRNVDMIVSDTRPNRIMLIEKWESPATQQTHFEGATMVEMAKSCTGILTGAPEIDIWQSMSAHDLT
ncbi:MAG: hypothetical protein F2916_00050 [Actinobacteria bacterium]|uniref:Unannotated protein n=2 Tax=freshwater metagenome TaxID=449393 RepID=A0A6J6NAL9_9ZZZZ|nr:hypothetical protein [Actinomycetota bacterium]MSZ60989.1 hypothetical protein [Actinomycetota bacterium]MSZ80377.1 hypothetical protein [Actinomycetota bacterium]MTB11950.1 hypothetical protein [Actinomycetota bacterium]